MKLHSQKKVVRATVVAVVLGTLAASFAACSSYNDGGRLNQSSNQASTGNGSNSNTGTGTDNTGPETPGGTAPASTDPDAGDDPGIVDAGGAATTIKATGISTVCKLISGNNEDSDGPSRVQALANLKKTEFGIPVKQNDNLFFFFGDSAGVNIWNWGVNSLPDAVGYSKVGYAAVSRDPQQLCSNLGILMNGQDFAGASMSAPANEDVGNYVKYPAGTRDRKYVFASLPGDSEVPTGAIEHNGSIYVFYTTVDGAHLTPLMTSSYLARWQSPSTSGRPDYQVLYHVDDRTNSSGPLGGNFINVAPIEYGGYLYIFGSGIGPNGELRKSAVYLARKSMAKIDTAGDFERIGTSPVVPSTGIGELSVQYYSDIGKFAMLTQEGQYLRIRFADAPEGPWSTPVVIAALNSADVRQTYCCNGTTCSDSQLYYCNQSNNQNGGFYAPYLLPGLRKNGNNFEISFTVSTWLPYNVALMTASFSLN